MRVERIGPVEGGGIMTEPGSSDMRATKEDFERIVRAANSHEALVAALEAVLPYARAAIGLPENSWPADSVILQARAALKLARQP
jgi:hypothetical protein